MGSEQRTGIKEVRRDGTTTIVTLAGDVDLKHSPRIHGALVDVADERPALVVLDLTSVEHMDSSGVGTLLEVYRRVQKYGGRLVLAGVQIAAGRGRSRNLSIRGWLWPARAMLALGGAALLVASALFPASSGMGFFVLAGAATLVASEIIGRFIFYASYDRVGV